MASDTKQSPPPGAPPVREYAARRVAALQSMFLRGEPAARGTLAQLRRADVPSPDGVLDVMTVAFVDPPESLIGRGDEPSRAEKALASALCLYSIHQQSKNEPMHVAGQGLGKAVRRLAIPEDSASREKPVMRRFQSLNTASDPSEVMHHLRGLIAQFRGDSIPLDYGALAEDLYRLQDPRTRTAVRLKWARELTRRSKKDAKEEASLPDSNN